MDEQQFKKQSKFGRPREDRLNPKDCAYIKKRIKEVHGSYRAFYEEMCKDAQKQRFPGFKQPADVETVERSFKYAFSGQRPLHDGYWELLIYDLEIVQELLPSRISLREKESFNSKVSFDENKIPILINLLISRRNSSIRHLLEHLFGEKIGENAWRFEPHNRSLSWELACVIAVKLVDGSVDAFYDFYSTDFWVTNALRLQVAQVISNDPSLRRNLAEKVGVCEFGDLIDWFRAFVPYCTCDIAKEVEKSFIKFITDPSFMPRYNKLSLEGISTLIYYFLRFGCLRAVKYLKAAYQDYEKLQ